jgi:eukaryotic-like serine/threonine-protein kinase
MEYAAMSMEAMSGEGEGVVRQLATPDVPTFLERVRAPHGDTHLIVVERAPRTDTTTDERAEEYVRDARAAMALEHPNVVRTRAIVIRQHEISLACDLVDGERLTELWRLASVTKTTFSLEMSLRILVDVLTGLDAVHKIRNEYGDQRVRLFHGQVTAANVLVGLDGTARLLRVCRTRIPDVLPSAGLGTIAPEVLSGGQVDQRADIYSAGALLWQALSGRALFEHADVDAILTCIQADRVERPPVPTDAPWAAPLADIAARAMATQPDKRFPTAIAMVTELRRIAGPRLATTLDVAKLVTTLAGAKIASRRRDAEDACPASSSRIAMAPPPMASGVSEPLSVQELSRAITSDAQNVFLRDSPVLASGRTAWSDPVAMSLGSSPPDGLPSRPAMTTESSLVVHTPEPMPARRRGTRGRLALVGAIALLGFAGWWLSSRRTDTPAGAAITSVSPTMTLSADAAPPLPLAATTSNVAQRASGMGITSSVPASKPVAHGKPPTHSKKRP